MSKNTSTATNVNTYDEVPYESNPYVQSHPATLKTLGTLFGMKPVALEKAKVLELGCAGGGNLIPVAAQYPNAKFVGVDLSQQQITTAQNAVNEMGLKNIEFKCMNLADIDKKFGEFDYVIAHGVVSWVNEDTQEKLFDICNANLTDNGIAYVSYNTLPGWNMVKTVREMMLYHSQSFETQQEQVQQSRLLLNFIKEATEGSETAYSRMLENEVKILSNQPDHFLRHDHMEENNTQFYFHEFMAKASKRGLQYLSDTNLASMFLGNMSGKVAEKLSEIKDIVRTEQYMDFVTNRRFRCTLLCKNTVPLNRNLQKEDVMNFSLQFNVLPAKAMADVKFDDATENLDFYLNGNTENKISTTSANMKAILYTFAENFNIPMKAEEIIKEATKKVKGAKTEEVKAEFINNAMRLVLSGHISLTTEENKFTTKVSKTPTASKLAQYQCKNVQGLWATNEKHERVGINLFEKVAMRYMDGKHNVDQIVDKVMEHVKKDELTISINDKKVTDEKVARTEIEKIAKNTFERLARAAFLVA